MPRRPCCSIGRRPGRRDAVIRDTAATLRQGSAPPAACAAAGARCSSPTGVHDVQRGTTSTSCPFPMIRRAFDDSRPAREGRRGVLPLDSQANERSNPTQIAMKRLLVGKDAQFRYWKLSRRWVKSVVAEANSRTQCGFTARQHYLYRFGGRRFMGQPGDRLPIPLRPKVKCTTSAIRAIRAYAVTDLKIRPGTDPGNWARRRK